MTDTASLVERLTRLLPLLSEITVRQAISAGDEVIDACGLDPWCMNEGTATGGEPALTSWQIERIVADLAALTAKDEQIARLEAERTAAIAASAQSEAEQPAAPDESALVEAEQDLLDEIEEAISESFDVDWTARDGARHVIGLLEMKGLIHG